MFKMADIVQFPGQSRNTNLMKCSTFQAWKQTDANQRDPTQSRDQFQKARFDVIPGMKTSSLMLSN